jgi:uncharacterized protein YciW
LRRDHTQADLSEQDRAMLDFVVRLTDAAYKITPDDHARLRAVGFDDVGILQITVIAAWFNYINRVADALGVGRPDPDPPPEGTPGQPGYAPAAPGPAPAASTSCRADSSTGLTR